MKKIFQLTALLILCFLGACNEDSRDGLSGKYDMERHNYTKIVEQSTEKVGKGVKRLSFLFEDEAGKQWSLIVYSREWVLPGGVYQLGESLDATVPGTFLCSVSTSLSDDKDLHAYVYSGTLEVTLLGDTYYLDGLFQLTDGKQYSCDYKGPINFEIGEDDPEASGYTISITENPVTDAENTVYPDLTKYAIVVADPDGNDVFEVDAVNRAGASMDDLVGTYTIQGYPTEVGLADNGWVVYMPQYGMQLAGGTYYTDATGVKRYVTGGQITITRAEDSEGQPLYSFSGSNLPTLTAQNELGEGGNFNLQFATYTKIDAPGTVLRDRTLHSEVLNRDMLYSVYLPASWNKDNNRTYPILYLLHGANSAPIYGDGSPANNGWIDGGQIDKQVDLAVATGAAPEMIVVMPNCTVDGKDLFYVDGYQGDAQYMTYFFTEFLPAMEAQYKAKGNRANRAVGGFSMGGYGSLYYGGLHPEMFSYVYACSPALVVEGTPNVFDLYGAASAGESGLPGITVEIGTSDFLFEQSTWFDGFMKGIGASYEYITREGTHDWAFWKACAPKIVKKLGEVFPAE